MAEIQNAVNYPPEFLQILNGVPHGIVLVDSNLRIVAMNRYLEVFTGYSAESVRGVSCDCVLRGDFSSNPEIFRLAVANGAPCAVEGDIIGLHRRKTPVRVSISPVADNAAVAGQPALVLVLDDITALRELDRRKDTGQVRGLLGHSPKMQEIFELLPVLAQTDSSVLIAGETGTGKDLLAEAIHHASRRSAAPFIKVNCGALPESLLESELFGHVRGAFTGAHADKRGMFQLAQGGTIFLTEIGDLPLPLQVKLLTVLDDREFYPLGSQKKVKVDIRLITATHRDLKKLVEEGRFREDLFFRLNVLRVQLPPLREREGDVPLLTDYFLGLFAGSLNKNVKTIAPGALERLVAYRFPGNVRELRNIIEHCVNLCRAEVIGLEHLPASIAVAGDAALSGRRPLSRAGATAEPSPALPQPLPEGASSWSEIEKRKILAVLVQTSGNRGAAATVLGWGRTTLWRKMKDYNLD